MPRFPPLSIPVSSARTPPRRFRFRIARRRGAGALSAEQLEQAHLALLAHSRDPELDDLVFQFLRETGCRRHGAIRLNHDDLAPATRAVRLVEKYAKQRWVPVSAHLIARLLAHSTARQSGGPGLVLHRANGSGLNDKWFEGLARRIQHLPWAAELGISAHWLRHTTITDIERSAGVRVAAAYAGHSDGNFGVTGTYTKASPEELQLAHPRLFFDNPPTPTTRVQGQNCTAAPARRERTTSTSSTRSRRGGGANSSNRTSIIDSPAAA